jgi:hypothetical protein
VAGVMVTGWGLFSTCCWLEIFSTKFITNLSVNPATKIKASIESSKGFGPGFDPDPQISSGFLH